MATAATSPPSRSNFLNLTLTLKLSLTILQLRPSKVCLSSVKLAARNQAQPQTQTQPLTAEPSTGKPLALHRLDYLAHPSPNTVKLYVPTTNIVNRASPRVRRRQSTVDLQLAALAREDDV